MAETADTAMVSTAQAANVARAREREVWGPASRRRRSSGSDMAVRTMPTHTITDEVTA